MENKPLIIVSNDDGISAKGIRFLTDVAKKLGEVIVVAPNSPQSGKGHAITIHDPLKVYQSELITDVKAYECSGTPADCIKLAKHFLLQGRKIDLVVSGINHGSNSSISVIYSGTMSAAIEAGIEGLPAIGFSLCQYDADADFSHTEDLVFQIIKNALEGRLQAGVVWNVNFPKNNGQAIQGVRFARQAKGKWQEFFEERTDPYGKKYLWLTGHFVNQDQEAQDTDEYALANNYASLVPCTFDLTSYEQLENYRKNWPQDAIFTQ